MNIVYLLYQSFFFFQVQASCQTSVNNAHFLEQSELLSSACIIVLERSS